MKKSIDTEILTKINELAAESVSVDVGKTVAFEVQAAISFDGKIYAVLRLETPHYRREDDVFIFCMEKDENDEYILLPEDDERIWNEVLAEYHKSQ